MPIKKMLVTTDLSPDAETALDTAIDLAEQLGAELTLLHVLDFTMMAPAGAMIPPHQEAEMRTEVSKQTSAMLEQIKKARAGRTKLPITAVAIESPGIAVAICTYAEQHGTDMIVIASHGRTGLSHLLIGSVAERVVRHAHCPVLVVRTKPEA